MARQSSIVSAETGDVTVSSEHRKALIYVSVSAILGISRSYYVDGCMNSRLLSLRVRLVVSL